MNERFNERPHTQPPSSSLNHATELLSPILQRVSSRQIIRAFKQAWSTVFDIMNEHASVSQTTSSTTQHPSSLNDTFSADSSAPFQPFYGPFPYHWIDPEYKPHTHRLLIPHSNTHDEPPLSPIPDTTSSSNSQPNVSSPLPLTPSPTVFVCNGCHGNISYSRFCRCTVIVFCSQCLSVTWTCPVCHCMTTIQKV